MTHTEAYPSFAQDLDYLGLAADGVVVTKTGVHIASWQFWGQDLDALPFSETFALAERISRGLGLGVGWTIQSDLIRREETEYIADQEYWSDAGQRLLEEERRSRFLDVRGKDAVRLSTYYVCLSYDPKQGGARGLMRSALGLQEEEVLSEADGADATLARFLAKVNEVQALLSSAVAGVRRLKGVMLPLGETMTHCDELLSYIRLCVCGKLFPFRVPSDGIDLSQYMATNDWTGGGGMSLGDEHVRVLAIDGFPDLSFAGILRVLDSTPCTFRFTQQARILDAVDAAKKHKGNANLLKRKGEGGFRPRLTQAGVHQLDPVALRLSGEAALARAEAEDGSEIACEYAGKIILMGKNLSLLAEQAEILVAALRQAGFNCRAEDINGESAWLGSLPGQQYKDLRHFLITTRNFAHLMPLSMPYLGSQYNPSPLFPRHSPPLFMALTGGNAPYRFHCHSHDLGHTLVVGPSGYGKTSAIALAMASAPRYERAQSYNFDKKGSLYTATICLGGTFQELGPNSSVRLCPLARLSTTEDRQHAERYVAFLAEMNGLPLTPALRNDIGDAVKLLARSPSSNRSLTALHSACSLRPLKEALVFYLRTILDGERDDLELSRFVTFEMDDLYALDERIMNGALFYVFGRIRRRLSADFPTFLFVDEFRAALSHPIASKAFGEFLAEGRKLNLAVWMVVQELSQTFASDLKHAILSQMGTKICLPNPQAALEAQSFYEALGCNDVERAAIAAATPKSDYYIKKPEGGRMVSLELGNVMLAFLSSSKKDQDRLKHWIAEMAREEAVARWLEWKGLPTRARRYRELAELTGDTLTAKEAVA